MSVRLSLLVRAYCHLCDDMRQALAAEIQSGRIAIDEIDVDSDATLEARWGDHVPVLLAGAVELCRYRFDGAALAAHLARE